MPANSIEYTIKEETREEMLSLTMHAWPRFLCVCLYARSKKLFLKAK